jgi:hypothetical protein
MSKTYQFEARVIVFATVYVEAQDEKEAQRKIRMGGGWWQSADFQTHTAECDDVESCKEVE